MLVLIKVTITRIELSAPVSQLAVVVAAAASSCLTSFELFRFQRLLLLSMLELNYFLIIFAFRLTTARTEPK